MTKHLGWIGLLTLSLLMLASEVFACPERMSDLTNNACRTTEATTRAGEDVANDVQKVEGRFAYSSSALLGTNVIKSGPGYLDHCTILGGAQGNVTLYDNTAAVATSVILPTFAYAATSPITFDIPLHVSTAVGITLVTSANTIWMCAYR